LLIPPPSILRRWASKHRGTDEARSSLCRDWTSRPRLRKFRERG